MGKASRSKWEQRLKEMATKLAIVSNTPTSSASTWGGIGMQVVAMGLGAWLGPEAGFWLAFVGLLFFIPLIREQIQSRGWSMFRHWKIFVPICALIGIIAVTAWYFVGPQIFENKVEQSSARPHIAMIPGLDTEGSEGFVVVMFHNRGREDVDKPVYKIILNIDGKDLPEQTRAVSISRVDTNRKVYVTFPRQLYEELIAGKMPLKVVSSVAYSLHGIPYTESCVTTWSASMRRFDYVDC